MPQFMIRYPTCPPCCLWLREGLNTRVPAGTSRTRDAGIRLPPFHTRYQVHQPSQPETSQQVVLHGPSVSGTPLLTAIGEVSAVVLNRGRKFIREFESG